MRLLLAIAIIAVLFILSPDEGRPPAATAARDLAARAVSALPPRVAGDGLAALLARPDVRDALGQAPAAAESRRGGTAAMPAGR